MGTGYPPWVVDLATDPERLWCCDAVALMTGIRGSCVVLLFLSPFMSMN